MKGGYYQYGSNIPNTPSYSVAGSTLSPSMVGLANPPPIHSLKPVGTVGNCCDNYRADINHGFQYWQ